MKKGETKITASTIILLLLVTVIGCGIMMLAYERNKRPDDDISRAICEAVGRKKVHYYGKEYFESGEIVVYGYTVYDYEDENLLKDMVEAANAVMKEKKITEKIHLAVREEMPGGLETVVSLYNYFEDEGRYERYEFFQCLDISGTERSNKGDASPYNKASTYINLPDIKRLVVTERIAENAEEEGIDWYEVWTDLEYYEVYER